MSKPIKNNSQLLYLQARQLFEQAQARFEDGTIKSEPLLVAAVFNSFQEFFTSMGKPNLIPRYAPEEGPPWSEDYNSMMSEVRADLELLFQEVDILGRSLYTDFNHNMVQHDILTKQFENVLDKMRDLELYSGTESSLDFGRDDFLNKSKIDYSRISGMPLELVDGAVTLPQLSRVNVAEDASITIIAGNRKANKFIIGTESNGFPGNNTEIHSVTDDILTNKNYIPTFLGEENNHSDYTVVLDGSPNTWFEFEKVNVREHDKIRVAKNLGWDYQVHENQTIQWAEDPENGVLKLHMQIILKEEKVINQINCNLYTPPNYGAKTAIVKNILVSDGREAPRSVLPKDKKDDQYSFHFAPVKAKVISVLFEQPHKYLTDIGHLFYEKKMQVEDNSEYAMDMATKKYKYAPRVEGPLISLEDLGIEVKVSESNVEANYRLLTAGDTESNSIGETINRLTNAADMDTVDMGVEKFEGFRWAIGVRDIEVFSCEYATEGELVTVPFYFDKPMDKISLHVNENIPPVFTSNPTIKYDWIKYFVSIDDGATWYPITPITHEVISKEQPPKIYTVRTVETSDQRLNWKEDYIESEYPVYSLRMKVVARRPEDYTTEGFMLKDQAVTPNTSFNQTSPIMSAYTFNITTNTDVTDSIESDRMAANVDIGSGVPIDPGAGEPPIDNGGMPSDAGGDNPWGDDDGDGIPNWADPDHPDYVANPPIGWMPPGNPGVYPDYPIGGWIGRRPSYGGSPDGDDDNDGTPNRNDPDWKPALTVIIKNKKTEWCSDEDLLVKGTIYSQNPLVKAELYLNNVKLYDQALTGNIQDVEFTVSKHELLEGSMTTLLKGYDSKGSAIDSDVLNIIDCTGMPEEDRPRERDSDELTIVIDKKPNELCECDTLSFYGSVQGPNQIQSVTFSINDISIDPNNLGTPLADDPCGAVAVASHIPEPEVISLSANGMTDADLMAIEDFGEWLDAFEEREDCGCKNKKKSAVHQFKMQSTPFRILEVSEQVFQVSIPYWKLRQIGVALNTEINVKVTAVDSLNQEASESFAVLVKDCEKPPTDENGNPRVRDCLMLESIEVHYYDHATASIASKTIPSNALPYQGISNGAGSGIIVGWKKAEKAPIIMQTSGNDETGYSFQIHAVGIHYLNEYDQPESTWTYMIGDKSPTVKNSEKMIGDPTRSSSWVSEIADGDYYNCPSLGGINDYAVFLMDNEWLSKACEVNITDFQPPELETERTPINDCNRMTHIALQFYDESIKDLRMYKVDVTSTGKDTYTLSTKNGNVTIVAGWVNYFKGPVIQIKQAAGTDNVLLTSIGLVYTDIYGDSQTAWATQLRYKTNGVRYAEYAVGEKKTLSDISWVQNGVVNYSQATYIGAQGDMVSYVIDQTVTDLLCAAEKPVDDTIGIDPTNPPDVPRITFVHEPSTICIEAETVELNGTGTDDVELKEVQYGIQINGIDVYGPYTESVSGTEFTFSYPVDTNSLQAGDMVSLYAKATNLFNMSAEHIVEIVAENCDTTPPVITLTTSMTQTNGKYCYSDLVSGAIPITLQVTDDVRIANWTASGNGWNQSEDYIAKEQLVSDTGALPYSIPVTITTAVDAYNRSYSADQTVTITTNATDKTGKTTTQTLVMVLTDCAYDPTPPMPPPIEAQCGDTAEGGNNSGTYIYTLGQTAGEVTITYDFYTAEDKMDVYYKDTLIAQTGVRTGTGTLAFNYSPQADDSTVKIVMNDGFAGSAWEYTVGCPVPPPPPPPVIPESLATYACGTYVSRKATGTEAYTITMGSTPGRVNMDWSAYNTTKIFDVYYKNTLIASTGEVMSMGVLSFDYSPTDGVQEIKVVITRFAPDTTFDFTVNCPVSTTSPNDITKFMIAADYYKVNSGSSSAVTAHAVRRQTGYENVTDKTAFSGAEGYGTWSTTTNGWFTATGGGNASLRGDCEGMTDMFVLSVGSTGSYDSIKTITRGIYSNQLAVGESTFAYARATPYSGSEYDIGNRLVVMQDDPTGIEINNQEIKGLKPGTYTVRVFLSDRESSASVYTITVT